MEGIGLDNMLGAEELDRFFSDSGGAAEETAAEQSGDTQDPDKNENNATEEETAEVDFTDLIGDNQSESVGSEENTEGNRETPESNSDSGTPHPNIFSSIARAVRDEGVFPDLSDEECDAIKDAAALKKMFDDEVSKALDDRQKRIEQALNGGATPDELQKYQQALSLEQYLENKETLETLVQENEAGENLRKQVMYQDYINRGFKHERAIKMVQKSIDDGTDMEDAKEAFESCKQHYKDIIDDYQNELKSRQQRKEEADKKQYETLKKGILDKENFYNGVKVDKGTRQKAYDSLTKPVYKDEQGNYMTALQKYQRENPVEFMENVALLYALTDGFKNVEKLAGSKARAKIKSSFEEVGNLLNNSKRDDLGNLVLGNTAFDDNRENWNLAL